MIRERANLGSSTVRTITQFPADDKADTQAFLAAIHADPQNDTPRLIFADWLDEQNDPRGSMVRLSCELARQPRLSPRWCELHHELRAWLDEYLDEWVGQLNIPFVMVTGVRRGLLQLRICAPDSDHWICQSDLPALDRVARQRWIGHVFFAGCPEGFASLRRDWPLVETAEWLGMRGSQRILDHHLPALVGLQQLYLLDLHWCTQLTDSAWETLTRLSQLQELRLSCNRMTAQGLRRIAQLREIRHLELQEGEGISDHFLQHLVTLPRLTHVSLTGFDQLTTHQITLLASSHKLSKLELYNCRRLYADTATRLRSHIPQVVIV